MITKSQRLLIKIGVIAVTLALICACSKNTSIGHRRMKAPNGETKWNNCISAAVFGDPAESPYILPYNVGEAYHITQSYCSHESHSGRFAYDFYMPFGTEIRASRAGIVISIKDCFGDNDRTGGHENGVFIMHHYDGKILEATSYLHFQQNGVLVEEGETVAKGQTIGLCGSSGTDFPHLHFMLLKLIGGELKTYPLNFSKTRGELDSRGGLINGKTYEALPWQ